MENTNALEMIIKLVAETGLFFAKVDGNYSERERAFFNAYIDQLVQQGGTRDEVMALIGDVEQRNITLEEVLDHTKALLARLSPDEGRVVKLTLRSFITDIIDADGEDCQAEKDAFKAWEEALY